MAVLNGKLYFSWVQRFRPCTSDPTSISANSHWQFTKPDLATWWPLATGKTKISAIGFLGVLCGFSKITSRFSAPLAMSGVQQ